jgi:hypothetical protein
VGDRRPRDRVALGDAGLVSSGRRQTRMEEFLAGIPARFACLVVKALIAWLLAH